MAEEIALKAMNRIIKVFLKNGYSMREDTYHDIITIVKMFMYEMRENKEKETTDV